jgi:hypothetical protein
MNGNTWHYALYTCPSKGLSCSHLMPFSKSNLPSLQLWKFLSGFLVFSSDFRCSLLIFSHSGWGVLETFHIMTWVELQGVSYVKKIT